MVNVDHRGASYHIYIYRRSSVETTQPGVAHFVRQLGLLSLQETGEFTRMSGQWFGVLLVDVSALWLVNLPPPNLHPSERRVNYEMYIKNHGFGRGI